MRWKDIFQENFVDASHGLHLVLLDHQLTLPQNIHPGCIFHLSVENMEYQTDENQQISHLHQIMDAVNPTTVQITLQDFPEYLRFIIYVVRVFTLLTWQSSRNTFGLSVLERRSRVLWQRIEALRLASARNRPSSVSSQLLMLSLGNIYTPENKTYKFTLTELC